jgi:CBS domain-containing protein
MSTARDLMHAGAECIGESDTLEKAARMMRDLRVGALPICGNDDRLKGIITVRDIVVRCVAEGGDPRSMTAREMAQLEAARA